MLMLFERRSCTSYLASNISSSERIYIYISAHVVVYEKKNPQH